MFSRNDGTEARLYDLRSDPEMNRDVAANRPDIAKRGCSTATSFRTQEDHCPPTDPWAGYPFKSSFLARP
jgi:hypothetical protein